MQFYRFPGDVRIDLLKQIANFQSVCGKNSYVSSLLLRDHRNITLRKMLIEQTVSLSSVQPVTVLAPCDADEGKTLQS